MSVWRETILAVEGPASLCGHDDEEMSENAAREQGGGQVTWHRSLQQPGWKSEVSIVSVCASCTVDKGSNHRNAASQTQYSNASKHILCSALAFPLSIFSRFERYMDNFVGLLPNFYNSVFSVSKRTFTGSVA